MGRFWLFISDAAKLDVLAEFLIPAAAFNCSWGHISQLSRKLIPSDPPSVQQPLPTVQIDSVSKSLLGLEPEA